MNISINKDPAIKYLHEESNKLESTLNSYPQEISIYSDLFYKNQLENLDFHWESRCLPARDLVRPAIQSIINGIASQHFKKEDKILEIGSGKLLENQSYLSHYFPGFNSWTFSDVPALANSYSSFNYQSLDLSQDLNSTFSLYSFDRIVGCSTIDTIPYKRMPNTLEKIEKLLNSEGQFIHFADVNMYLTSFLEACAQKDTIIFPGKDFKSVERIQKAEYEEALKQNKNTLETQDFLFLESWGKKRPTVQAFAISNLCHEAASLSHLEKIIRETFSNRITIEPVQLFENTLKTAAQERNWTVLKCGMQSHTMMVNRIVNPHFNRYELNGTMKEEYDKTIPPGQESVTAHVHVFVASPPA
jgi:hypothetical protein